MSNLFKIAIRNLLRYKRRTLLTASLITIGVAVRNADNPGAYSGIFAAG